MANIYKVFNTNSDYEFSKFFDKLDLNTNELLNVTYIAENSLYNINDKRKKILEIMAGSANGNYEICLEQFNKNKKERLLKENSFQQLNLNQIMELNQLVEDVAKKLKAPNCMQGIFNIIKTKSNANVANTFLGMVQQSQVNDSNLKFNTELQVNGQNLAQIIYQMKNDIEMFINSVECPKEEQTEKKEIKENNDLTPYNRIAGIYDINTNTFTILNKGEMHNLNLQDYKNGKIRYGIQNTNQYGLVCYITAIDKGYAYQTMKKIKRKYNDLNINVFNLEFKTDDGKKIFVKLDSNGRQLFENKNICHFTSEEVKQMIEEDKIRKSIPLEQTISSIKTWVQSVNKPSSLETLIQMIDEYISVAKNNIQANTLAHLKSIAQTKLNKLNNESPKVEECVAQQVISNVCEEDTFNSLLNSLKPTMISITVNKETGDIENDCISPDCVKPEISVSKYPEPVQSLTISPTAIDAPILKKPNSAEATSAMTALASHINCIKSDSRENNIEELETINTLLNQLSNYFNSVLTESSNNSLKDEFNKYSHEINSLEELIDIVSSVLPDSNSGYRKILHRKLISYLESIFGVTKDINSWNQEPDNIIASIIDDNVDKDSLKRQVFISQELQLLFKINPELTYDIVKDYVSSYYPENNDVDLDYWDGEDDELNENFDYNKYKKFIGKTVKDGNDEFYTIIDVNNDRFNTFFKLKEENTDNILLATIGEMKTYFDLDVNNYVTPDDYWDGEDEELNETFGDGMSDPNEELEQDITNDKLSEEDITYLKNKLPKMLKNEFSNYSSNENKLKKFVSDVLDNCLYDEYNYLLDKPYIDVEYIKLPSGRIFDLESYMNEFNLSLESLEPDDYWDGEDELDENINSEKLFKNEQLMNEDTVYDHSWYENEDGNYPERTKEGVIGLPIKETCSAGATCAASVSGFAKPLGSKPKKRKKSSVDVEMFKESINNDIPCAITINSNKIKYNIFDNKGYLFINEGIVKAITKQQILEAVDDIYNNCLELPIFEGINTYQFDMLMEDDLNTNTIITPQEKQEQEQELDNEIKANPQLKVGLTDDKSSQMINNQELIGVDDSNLQDKKYIVKDPNTGKVKVANSSQIKIMKNDNGVQ